MRFSDLLVGLLFLAGAGALFVAASGLPPIPGQSYGADVFPVLTSAGLAACGFLLCVGAVRAGPFPLARATWVREPGALFRAAGTVVLVAGYLVLAPRIGFVATSVLMLVGLFLLVRVRPQVAVPVAVLASITVYVAFNHLLRVPLPRGLVEGFL